MGAENREFEQRDINTSGGNYNERIGRDYIQNNYYAAGISVLVVVVFSAVAGGIALGKYTNPQPSPTPISTQRNINTGGGNYNENVVNNYHNSILEGIPSLRQGMPYEQARKILADAGWQTIFNRFPLAATEAQTRLIVNQKGWVELESCSGAGLGLCTFQFRDAAGRILRVVTANNSPEPNSSELNSTVFRWFLEEEDNL